MSACARAILYVSSSAFMLLALGIQPMASNTAGMPMESAREQSALAPRCP
jgi:hypothetical protein